MKENLKCEILSLSIVNRLRKKSNEQRAHLMNQFHRLSGKCNFSPEELAQLHEFVQNYVILTVNDWRALESEVVSVLSAIERSLLVSFFIEKVPMAPKNWSMRLRPTVDGLRIQQLMGLWDYLFFSTAPTTVTITGMLLIIAAGILVVRRRG